jgi:hypothetical protein
VRPLLSGAIRLTGFPSADSLRFSLRETGERPIDLWTPPASAVVAVYWKYKASKEDGKCSHFSHGFALTTCAAD